MTNREELNKAEILITHVRQQLTLILQSEQAFDSCRLFHGRGKTFAGLEWCCVDYFYPAMVLTFFQEPEKDFESRVKELLIELVSQPVHVAVQSHDAFVMDSIMVQRRYLPGAPFECWWGQPPEELYARRDELKFQLSFGQQNIGYFLDIEPARKWLETTVASLHRHGKDVKVLNLFAYTCAFSVVAKKAGAQRVVNIDLSKKSLATGRKNHLLSGVSSDNVSFLPHDIFKSWGKLRKNGPYDVVIIDPPSFQKGSFIASKDYARLLTKMPDLVASDGVFLACLNAPEIKRRDFQKQVEQHCPEFACTDILAPDKDFPEAEPERALKLLVFQKNNV